LGTSPKLVVISAKSGRDLDIFVRPDSPHLDEYLRMFDEQLHRQFQPEGVITIEKINGERARSSPYLNRLKELFNVTADYRSVKLWRVAAGTGGIRTR